MEIAFLAIAPHAIRHAGLLIYNETMKLDFSHHAYLIEGERELVLADVHASIEKVAPLRKEASKGQGGANPNIFFFDYDSFGIDESRELKARQSMKGFLEGKKFLIIAARAFTHEAQNALLKVFEDPTPDTHFVIIIPDGSGLLPTLRSRLTIMSGREGDTRQPLAHARKFIAGDTADRLGILKKLIDDKETAKASAITLVNALEQTLYAEFAQEHDPALGSALADLETYRSYLADRSPSVKMILEHLALTLPRF